MFICSLTWHQPHCSTPWLQCLQTALLLSPWEGGGQAGRNEGKKRRRWKRKTQRDRQEGEEREAVSIHKPTAVTCMDEMSVCVCMCIQNILTGQRLGNESLPLKCCHGVSLQERGWALRHVKNCCSVRLFSLQRGERKWTIWSGVQMLHRVFYTLRYDRGSSA